MEPALNPRSTGPQCKDHPHEQGLLLSRGHSSAHMSPAQTLQSSQSQQQSGTVHEAHVLGLALSMGHSTVQVRTSTMNTVVRLM